MMPIWLEKRTSRRHLIRILVLCVNELLVYRTVKRETSKFPPCLTSRGIFPSKRKEKTKPNEYLKQTYNILHGGPEAVGI